jgi:hypothetical protein
MKTLKQFEKEELPFDKFLKPLDRIDEELYHHIGCGWVASNYVDQKWTQNGECNREEFGIRFYETCIHVGDKFYYLGEAPSFNPHAY